MGHAELVRFLLTRITEEETSARSALKSSRDDIARSHAERALVECKSRRAIVGEAQQLVVLRDTPADRVVRHAGDQILRHMAVPYARHPLYRAEWSPRALRS